MQKTTRTLSTALLLLQTLATLSCSDSNSLEPGPTSPPPDQISVQITTAFDSLILGDSRQFAARVFNQFNASRDRVVNWSSSNPSVAAVSRFGVVSAMSPGATLVIASADQAADTALVIVNGSVSALSVSPEAVSAMQGDAIQLTASARLTTGGSITATNAAWSSSDTAVARVGADGTVESVGVGSAMITAQFLGVAAAAAVDVKKNDVTSVLISPANSSIYPAQTVTLIASLYGSNGRPLTRKNIAWTSSDPAVATVTSSGVVTGVAKGTAIIVADAGSASASATVNVLDVPVSSVTVSLPASTLSVGQTMQASATLLDASGNQLTGRVIAWQSSNPSVATVNASGLVTGIAAGDAIISAISDAVIGRAPLTIVNAIPSSLLIVPGNVSLPPGQATELSAHEYDQSGGTITNHPVSWSSSDASVATVNSSGVVSAISSGTATIRASVDGLQAQSSVSVSTVTAASVSVTPTSTSLVAGNSYQLTAVVRDAGGATLTNRVVTWTSSNGAVATVSSSGLVTGASAGTAVVTASVDGVSATCSVSVSAPPPVTVASVAVSLAASTLNVGQTTQATATLRDASGNIITGRTVTWSSANSSVATVSSSGVVSAMNSGSVAIVASIDGVSGAQTLTVNAPATASVATVTVTASATSLLVGQTSQLTVVLRDASGNVLTGRTVAFSTSNSAIGTVSPSGLVTAVGPGEVTITATSDGKSGMVTLWVSSSVTTSPVPASITVTLNSSSLSVGQLTQASAVVKDAAGNVMDAATVTWNSSNTSIATVNSNATVAALSAGTASIVASAGGVSGSSAVSVQAPVASVSVSLASSTVAPGQTTQATAVLKDASNNILTGRSITWASSNTAVATVNSSGLVTAVAAGTASIQATSEGKTGLASMTVSTTTTATVASVSVSLASPSLLVGLTTQATAVARDASGNVISGVTVTWSVTSGTSVASVSASGLVTAIAAGSATITAVISGKSGNATLSVTSSSTSTLLPAAPALPQSTVNTAYVAPTGRSITVNAGGNLQSAIDNAAPGDVILLQPGATFAGPFYLRKKSGSGWITIRTAASDAQLPAAGQRMTPTYASLLPKLISNGLNQSVIYTDAGASYYRLMGLEVTANSSVTSLNALVRLGDASLSNPTYLASNLILDRMYIHGWSTMDLQRCVMLNSASTAIIDSYLSQCASWNYDSQAIGGWNGPGPYKISNNFLEAAGENILFGGADPSITGLIPSDIEITHNHIYKPGAWKGTKMVIKTLVELKNAQRVLIEGNVLDGSWAQGQAGTAFNIKSANQSGGCSWCSTGDVTIRYNRVRNVGAGVALSGMDATNYAVTTRTHRVRLEHNVFDEINSPQYPGASYLFLAIAGSNNVTIEHNTITSTYSISHLLSLDVSPSITTFAFRCNLTMEGQYGVKGNGVAGGVASLDAYTPGWTWTTNLLIGGASASMPPTTSFASSISAVGFLSASTGDYTLSSSSPYRHGCYDGSDPGADIATVSAKIAGVIVP